MSLRSDDRRHRSGARGRARRGSCAAGCRCSTSAYWPPGMREVPGQQPHELLQVADERRVAVHLHAEVLEHRDARGRRDPARRGADQRLVDAADLAVPGDRHLAERGEHRARRRTRGRPSQSRSTSPSSTSTAAMAAMQPCVAAGPHLQVEVGHRRGLGDPRVDHDHRPAGIGGDRLERRAGVGDAVARSTGSCRRRTRPRSARSRRGAVCRTSCP